MFFSRGNARVFNYWTSKSEMGETQVQPTENLHLGDSGTCRIRQPCLASNFYKLAQAHKLGH
jgi:hypothetical protein